MSKLMSGKILFRLKSFCMRVVFELDSDRRRCANSTMDNKNIIHDITMVTLQLREKLSVGFLWTTRETQLVTPAEKCNKPLVFEKSSGKYFRIGIYMLVNVEYC